MQLHDVLKLKSMSEQCSCLFTIISTHLWFHFFVVLSEGGALCPIPSNMTCVIMIETEMHESRNLLCVQRNLLVKIMVNIATQSVSKVTTGT